MSEIVVVDMMSYTSRLFEHMCCHAREFNKNLVKPRTNTEVEAFKKKKKGKKAPAGDDAMGALPACVCCPRLAQAACKSPGCQFVVRTCHT